MMEIRVNKTIAAANFGIIETQAETRIPVESAPEQENSAEPT